MVPDEDDPPDRPAAAAPPGGQAELSGTELAGLWSRKRRARPGARDRRPDEAPDEPPPPRT